MAEMVHLNHLLLNVLTRFEISIGFGDATIEEICNRHKIDVNFFLDIVNTYHHKDYFPKKHLQKYPVSIIIQYLRKTHQYYIEIKLPDLEKLLRQTIEQCYTDKKTIDMILNFFADYRTHLLKHLEREDVEVFPYVQWLEKVVPDANNSLEIRKRLTDFSITEYKNTHDDVEEVLHDLQNLIIKYLPEPKNSHACNKLLFEIFTFETDLFDHSRIEEKVMIPKALSFEKELLTKLK